jgi:hypothetical protein
LFGSLSRKFAARARRKRDGAIQDRRELSFELQAKAFSAIQMEATPVTE